MTTINPVFPNGFSELDNDKKDGYGLYVDLISEFSMQAKLDGDREIVFMRADLNDSSQISSDMIREAKQGESVGIRMKSSKNNNYEVKYPEMGPQAFRNKYRKIKPIKQQTAATGLLTQGIEEFSIDSIVYRIEAPTFLQSFGDSKYIYVEMATSSNSYRWSSVPINRKVTDLLDDHGRVYPDNFLNKNRSFLILQNIVYDGMYLTDLLEKGLDIEDLARNPLDADRFPWRGITRPCPSRLDIPASLIGDEPDMEVYDMMQVTPGETILFSCRVDGELKLSGATEKVVDEIREQRYEQGECKYHYPTGEEYVSEVQIVKRSGKEKKALMFSNEIIDASDIEWGESAYIDASEESIRIAPLTPSHKSPRRKMGSTAKQSKTFEDKSLFLPKDTELSEGDEFEFSVDNGDIIGVSTDEETTNPELESTTQQALSDD